MAGDPVAKFRQVFDARLASGKYEPIDVVQAVKGLVTSAQLVTSLDVYCARFDPEKPPTSRNSFELCRTTGYNLFVRALELSHPQNELLELVRSLATTSPGEVRDAQLVKHLAGYRKRYDVLDQKDRDELQRRATKLTDERAVEASKRRFLLDDLEKEFRNRRGRPPQGAELLSFDPGPLDARKEFERLATACEAAFFPKGSGTSGLWVQGQFIPQPGVKQPPEKSSVVATQRVQDAFAAFGRFVEQQIRQPLDLFRLLAWAREPSSIYDRIEVHGSGTVRRSVQRRWAGAWQELYQDIAVRGLLVAVNRWTVAQMIQARGYVGKDLQFIFAPLEAHWQELLKRRLTECFKATRAFTEAQNGRRRAKVWGDLKGLELVDELTSESLMRDLVAEVEADPKEVLARKLAIRTDRVVYQSTYHIYGSAKDVFTVVWIPKQRHTEVGYVEVHAIPGLLFKAWGDRVGLEGLLEDKAYADLAANAAALTQFLLFYLQVLGYALDIITAGASGGVRIIIMRFIEERIKDKLIAEGLDLAGIDNPWIQTLAGFAAGMAPSAIKAPKGLKNLEQLEREAQTVTRGRSKAKAEPHVTEGVDAPKPKLEAPAAPALSPQTPTIPSAPGAPPNIGNNVFIVPKAPAAEAAGRAARATSRPPKLPGLFDRAKDYLVDVTSRAADRASIPVLAGQAEGHAGQAAAGLVFSTRLKPGVVAPAAGGGAGGRGAQRVAMAAARLRKSDDFRLLERYEREIMTDAERLASRKARVAITTAVERGVITEEEAFSKIRTQLNDAREAAGELHAAADLHSCFDVHDFVAVPIRENGVPVLDVAVKLRAGSAINAGKKFAFGEAKGGLKTRLGKVTAKRYSHSGGKLRFDPQPRRPMIRQASGEWYYQKFAEIYMMGQELGGAAGKKFQSLANEMFDAARKGEIATVVAKSDVALERNFIDTTEQVVAWFKAQNWDLSKGFPITR